MYNTLSITKDLMNKYDLYAKKSFGQNFLIDDNILSSISNLPNVNKDDLIIEIGPGLGNLTEYLKDKANLLLFEIDPRMIEVLKNRFMNEKNIELLNMDILKTDIDCEINKLEKNKKSNFKSVKVVANLPYYITSPILFKLLEESERIDEIIVMLQKEVADRINAKINTKDYGILTIMVDFYADSNVELVVKPSSFIPAPNVTSAVIRIVKKNKYEIVDIDMFRKLVHKAFANRRKKMINSLYLNNFLNLSKEELENIFKRVNISENTRAEELTTFKYVELANIISHLD